MHCKTKAPAPPADLRCDFHNPLTGPVINNSRPVFCWRLADRLGVPPAQCRIMVGTDAARLMAGSADMWDSGPMPAPLDPVRYAGAALRPFTVYYWQAGFAGAAGQAYAYSAIAFFSTWSLQPGDYLEAAQAMVTEDRRRPAVCEKINGGRWFFDFGQDAFGTLELSIQADVPHTVTVRMGEVQSPAGLAVCAPPPRSPACSRRFRELELEIAPGRRRYRLKLPKPEFGDAYQPKNYNCAAARTIPCPAHTGEFMPFRYVELAGVPDRLRPCDVERTVAHYRFDGQASAFSSPDENLNQIWNLCKHTLKAASCFGIYIDGDRERLAYAGDAWLAQLAHGAVDCDYSMGRTTLLRLLSDGCWCYEWALALPAMAWTDYRHTADRDFLRQHFDALYPMALWDLKRPDGLLATGEISRPHPLFDKLHNRDAIFRDLVDWPAVLRDDYEIGRVNLSANIFHWRALGCLAGMADALERTKQARAIRAEQLRVGRAMYRVLFDDGRGLFVDSEGSRHHSLHANALPLALGLARDRHIPGIVDFLKSRGMRCGLWGAFFLLEALWRGNAAGQAIELMEADGDRSWAGMLRQGATMTMECWNDALKPNQSWTHVWGATPAYLIARRLMGVRPLSPGFARILIAPQPGTLPTARLRTPTIRGPVGVNFAQSENSFALEADLPPGISAEIRLPVPPGMRPAYLEPGFRFSPERHCAIRRRVPPGRHVFQAEWQPEK